MLVEDGLRFERHPPDGVEGNSGLRVEVDAQLVGMVGVGAAYRPRVQVETSQVDRPQDVGHVHRAQLLGVRPLGNATVTVSSQSGRDGGTRFW